MPPRKSITLSCISIKSNSFARQLHEAFAQQGEVLVVIQKSLGSIAQQPRCYHLLKTKEEFDVLLQQYQPQPDLFVITGNPLPIRGIADDILLQQALHTLQLPNEFLLISLEDNATSVPQQFEGDLQWELAAIFDEFRGQQVAFGNFSRQFLPRKSTRSTIRQKLPLLTEARIGLQRKGQNHIEVVSTFDATVSGQKTKLGGSPEWIQRDDTPKCPGCRRKMMFVAQIDSFDQGSSQQDIVPSYMFADVGMIYVFYCFDCLRTKSVVQFH